ncbi:AAA family ATPase [Ruminococcus sp.]|uniref:AAA family ATPase n=1 Tax=Ruminococcus sp. TaxID=41978 RepID=UPI0025ED9E7D|nr:AAA family ATPase [Ruminococcus sp.]MCR4640284.1 AAA family ATPase [Ruminococcus sp.]
MLGTNELYLTGLKVKWDKIEQHSYLRKISAIRELDEMSFNTPVTFFVGENGSGKSTLLEAIAVAYGFNPEGGTLNYSFSTYDSHSELHDAVRLVRSFNKAKWGYFLRAESFYNVATAEEYYSRIQGIPQHYHEKSHGESFLSVIQKNFDKNGLYILDEPEAALSPQRQLTLMLEMSKCVKNDSQFIIVTHSPILLGFPNAEILSFDEGAIKPISYEDTQSYQITKMFINDRRQIFRHLFEKLD